MLKKHNQEFNKKFKVLEKMKNDLSLRNRKAFYNEIFLDWTNKKSLLPDKLVCFWCMDIMTPGEYFEKMQYFVSSKGGEVFERPTYGHQKFNKLYQDTFNVELCETCYYNLDMYNKTGLWFYNIK